MADRNITLFALHLHNDGDLQFGPERIGTSEPKETGVRGRLRSRRDALPIPLAAGAVALLAAAALAWRALASS